MLVRHGQMERLNGAGSVNKKFGRFVMSSVDPHRKEPLDYVIKPAQGSPITQMSRPANDGTDIRQPMTGNEFRRAFDKLKKELDSGVPLRNDAPRGFYLNISV